MLKNISPLISPVLMKTLMEMGHGDELILADGNFPAHSQGVPVIRADGHGVTDLLEAILTYFPLDTYTKNPVALMAVVEGDKTQPTIWKAYEGELMKAGYETGLIGYLDRFDFYDRSKKAVAIVATSEKALYANILLKKGVV